MAAAHDRTRSAATVAYAYRRAVPIGAAGCALVAGVLLLGNPFTTPPAPRAPRPEIRPGTAELSLPEPAPIQLVPAPPKPAPAPVKQASAPAFVVPSAPAPAATAVPAAAPPARTPSPPAARRIGGGQRATIVVETLPAKPIIPPFLPKQPAGATPEPHLPLPLDTEIEAKGAASLVPAVSPAAKTAAASLARNG
jgi:DNA segregation ATPase FtsK/SpoIIIE, S-DNA-T family